MKTFPCRSACLSAVLLLACALGDQAAHAQSRPPASLGADVIVGELPDISNNTPSGAAADIGFDSFAVGTTSCNMGDTQLLWYRDTNQHPVIGQNLFRLHNGRFEQIGQAWLKHGFTALQGTACTASTSFPHTACANSGTGTLLGVGCSDPYSSGLNNSQSGLGPKWQVNAAKGVFPYPYENPSFSGETPRRLRVRTSDLNATTFSGARYFVEGQYVVPDDAGYGNGANSASYREVTISGASSNYTMNFASGSTTIRTQPAIMVWATIDPTVQILPIDIVNDGRFILACKVTGPDAGVYTYEYALHNLTSDRCAGSFNVPFPGGSSITNPAFRDVEYLAGERNATPADPASDDWSIVNTGAAMVWSGPAYAGTPATYTISGPSPTTTQSFRLSAWTQGTGNDHSANVLRWGTMFNFRFQSDVAPAQGTVQIGLWRPGSMPAVSVPIATPGGATIGQESTGPCCVSQACTVTTKTACTGTFGAVGASCEPNPCTAPLTGACCLASGQCVITRSNACGGAYKGDDSTCAAVNCPPPTGACCNSGACTNVTQPECAGVFLGNSSVCTPTSCANNNFCVGARPLCDGVPTLGDNLTATTDATASCATTTGNDVWFSYTPTVAGPITIEILEDGGTLTDTVLSVYAACAGSQIACNDDTPDSNLSRISNLSVSAGLTYPIRVASWGTTARGTFTIQVTGGGACASVSSGACCTASGCATSTEANCTGTWLAGGVCSPSPCPPLNDACENRPGVGPGLTPYSTVNATTDGLSHATCTFFSSSAIYNDVWFNFPCTFNGTLDINTCDATFDTKLAVYQGYGCQDFEARLIACNDDSPLCVGSGTRSAVSVPVVAGEHYTIRVGSYSSSSTGTGNLNVVTHPAGACCAQTACTITAPESCTGSWMGGTSVCGSPENPTTCCLANFNQLGGVTVQDIFDFLGAWFAGSTAANVNADAGVSVQDIFDFLAMWFAGC